MKYVTITTWTGNKSLQSLHDKNKNSQEVFK